MEIEQPSILEASEPVSKAVNEISKTGLPVLITKGGKYFGIIDERSIRQHTSSPEKVKCEGIAERTPTLAPDATVMDACNAFFAGRFKAIPIIEGGKIKGAITRHTLLTELLTEKILSKKRVREVMTSPVETIDLSSSVGQARSDLRKYNIRRLVVTKSGKIVGLLSLFDLANYLSNPRHSDVFARGGEKTSMDAQPLASYMRKQVETIADSDSLSSAVKKMLEQRVAALIVSDGGYPTGIVTAKDILHAALSDEKTARVFVSGLPYEQRDYQAEFVSEGEKLLSRIGKSTEVSSLAFHVKSDGSGFSVRASLIGKVQLNASASDFRLETALHHVVAEIRRMAEKGKTEKLAKHKKSTRTDD
ncbi:MAG: CBS domain-containing protein [Candidatus Micrarchaeia archaeon]